MQLNEKLMPAGPWKYSEDRSIKTIRQCAAGIPAAVFFALAAGATVLSLGLLAIGKRNWGTFVGTWVPAWLIIGVYTEIVRLEEHADAD